jgi:hypothetical protein
MDAMTVAANVGSPVWLLLVVVLILFDATARRRRFDSLDPGEAMSSPWRQG